MTQKRQGQRGSSLVELLMVLALIAVFGACLFSLIFAGSSAYEQLESSRMVEGDARVAVSFINVKLRQSDADGCVRVVPLDNGKNALLLIDPNAPSVNTWVFFDSGTLYECLVSDGMPPTLSTANVIAQLEDCDIALEAGGVRVRITYLHEGVPREVDTLVSLRAASALSDR